MPQDTILEFAGEDDGPAINRLFEDVFGGQRTLAYWHWKFFENPHGRPLILIARRGERIVGHYGLMPRKVRYGDREMTAYQEVDLMIDRGAAGGGLFRRMGREIYRSAREAGGVFTFGFPNQTSLPAGRRILKWRAIGRIPLFTWPVRGAAVMGRRERSFPGRKIIEGVLTSALRVYAQLRVGKPVRIGEGAFPPGVDFVPDGANRFVFVRDEAYIRWRYEACPLGRYEYIGREGVGGAVVGFIGEEAYLMELRYASRESMRDIIAGSIAAAWNRGCRVLRAWALEESPEAGGFSRCGFFRRDSKLYHVIRSFQPPEFNRLLWDPRRWYVSPGDSDCV